MSPVIAYRGRLIVLGVLLLLVSFGAMSVWDAPAAGIAYFDFLPIALIALATGPVWASVAGLGAGAVYPLAALVADQPSGPELLSTTSGVRLVAYVGVGALIGWFAREQRLAAAQLGALATRDPLTGLLNVRAHQQALGRRIAEGRRFVLVLADMDGLKQINDLEGHSAGNDALQRMASVLAAEVRAEDDVARIGGDEFSIVAAGAGPDDAAALTARVAADLAGMHLSASFGWSVFPDDGEDPDALFRCADARLYEGKRFRQRARAAR